MDRGPKLAVAPSRLYARVWSVINSATDGGDTQFPVVWMPAHTAAHDEGILYKSDGTALSAQDRKANARADHLAKAAAQGQRYSRCIHQAVQAEARQVADMAVWLAK
eukprot:9705589-Karenia_brevis.AAC.1